MSFFSQYKNLLKKKKPTYHIRKMPKRVSGMGALSEALRLRAKISRVSNGSITPSSQRRAEE
jgi:hypothetical protein